LHDRNISRRTRYALSGTSLRLNVAITPVSGY
jgi:hypothetical protein